MREETLPRICHAGIFLQEWQTLTEHFRFPESVTLSAFRCATALIAFSCTASALCLVSMCFFGEYLKSSLTHSTLDERSELTILTCIWMVSCFCYTVGRLFIRNNCAHKSAHWLECKYLKTLAITLVKPHNIILSVTFNCLGGDRITRIKGSKRLTWGKCK